MSKVLIDRELLERAMYAKDGKELMAANRELRAILAQPEDPEGFEIARHSKRLVEQLRSDLSAVTAERDNYKSWYDDAMDASNIAGFAGMAAAQVIDYQDKEIMHLRAEADLLRKDAERWRYVRLQGDDTHWLNLLRVDLEDFGGNVDAAVDALIQ